MMIEITDENFEAIVNENTKPLVIDFWAPGCGPCQLIAPHLEELAETYKDEVIIGKVNTQEHYGLAGKFGVRNIPTVYFIKDGQAIDKQVGATAKSVLEEKIAALI